MSQIGKKENKRGDPLILQAFGVLASQSTEMLNLGKQFALCSAIIMISLP